MLVSEGVCFHSLEHIYFLLIHLLAVKYYPPKTNNDLRNLHKAIIETAGEDHVKLSILYYLLLDFDASTGRRDYSMSFEQRSFLPQKYQIYIKGLWHMDRMDFEVSIHNCPKQKRVKLTKISQHFST